MPAMRVDMRGNGDSDGAHARRICQAGAGRRPRGHRLGSPPSPGAPAAVGMMGISWGGFNGLQVAARRPPALKAIITLCSTDDRYADDIHYKGGCVINENLGWGGTMLAYSSRPPDPALVGERWRAHVAGAARQPSPSWPPIGCSHPHRDAYWKHGSVCEDFAAIEAAVLAVGGWNDAYSNAVPRLLAGLRSPVQGDHRPLGPQISAFRHARTADRLPAGGAALVGLLAEGRADRRAARSGGALLRARLDQARQSPENLAGALAGGRLLAGTGHRAPHPPFDRRRTSHRSRRAAPLYRLLARGHRPRRRRILHHLARSGIPRRPGARRSGLAHLRQRHPVRGGRHRRRSRDRARMRCRQACGASSPSASTTSGPTGRLAASPTPSGISAIATATNSPRPSSRGGATVSGSSSTTSPGACRRATGSGSLSRPPIGR